MATYEFLYNTMASKHSKRQNSINENMFGDCKRCTQSEDDYCDEDCGFDELYKSLDQDTLIEHFFYQGSDSLMLRNDSMGYLIIANETGNIDDIGIAVRLSREDLYDFISTGVTIKSNIEGSHVYLQMIGDYVAVIDVEHNKCFTFTDSALYFLDSNM